MSGSIKGLNLLITGFLSRDEPFTITASSGGFVDFSSFLLT